MPSSVGSSAPSKVNLTSSKRTVCARLGAGASTRMASSGSWTEGSHCKTAVMRSAAAWARGQIMKIIESIMTDMSNSMAYWMIAIRSPAWKLPKSTNCAPTQAMTMITRSSTKPISGMSTDIRRATETLVSASTLLATEKRPSSKLSLLYALMTRIPVRPSRVTRLRSSMRACRDRRSGTVNFMTIATMTAMMGMAANTAIESSTLFWNAMKAAPTNMMGAIMAIVMLMRAKRSSCWMSLVVRVMRDEVPNSPISRRLNAVTRL